MKGDYYVSARLAEYPYDTFERRAGLTDVEAATLRNDLERLEERGVLADVAVEEAIPEWYTIGYEATLAAVMDMVPEQEEDD